MHRCEPRSLSLSLSVSLSLCCISFNLQRGPWKFYKYASIRSFVSAPRGAIIENLSEFEPSDINDCVIVELLRNQGAKEEIGLPGLRWLL